MKQRLGKRDLVSSFDAAFRGFIHLLQTERNFRIHCGVAVAVIMGSLLFNLPLPEFLLLILTIVAVLTAEIVNTLVEMITDSFVQEYKVQAKRIKDAGAALVLLAATGSMIIGFLVLAKHFPPNWRYAFEAVASSPWYITFVILLLVSVISIVLKFTLRRGSLLTGGMPSIHSGISFSIWAIISFLTFREQPVISLIALIPAFWVAQSRVLRRIHRVEEVVIGALTGILVTALVFQVLRRFQ